MTIALNIGFLSYAIAAIAYLLLTILLALSWRSKALGMPIVVAAAMTVVWATVSAIAAIIPAFSPPLLQFAEFGRNACWLLFLLTTLGNREGDDQEGDEVVVAAEPSQSLRSFKRGIAGILTVFGSVLLLAAVTEPSGSLQSLSQDLIQVGWVLVAIIGLLLVEQLYRHSSRERRWAIKFLCLGLGLLFAFDFYLYSDALLFKRLDPLLWLARGVVNAMVVPFLAVAVARNTRFDVALHVSRDVVFHSVTVLGAGLYLLGMAGAGYFIRYYGGTWGGVLQIVFLVAAGVLLLVLLFSGSIRASLRVFLSKHFFSYKYDYREEWQKFTRALAERTNEVPVRLVRAIATLMNSPAGMLWEWRPRGECSLLARWNVPEHQAKSEGALDSLHQFFEKTEWVVDVDEYQHSPDIYQDLEMPSWLLDINSAWLLVPLLSRGRALGFVLLKRPETINPINWEDRDLLKIAGSQAASHLAQYQADRALVKARQFEAFNRLSAYVVHDLKNILAQQSLIVTNAEKHKHNPQFIDDVIETVRNSVTRMTRLMEQMQSGARGSKIQGVSLYPLLAMLVARRAHFQPTPVLETGEPDPLVVVKADREQLATVFGHLIQNAQEATARDGRVSVRLKAENEWIAVEVEDTGCGMEADFIRDRLFTPFDSTKGLTGMGVGAYEAREYIRTLGGQLQVTSTPGSGSLFRVLLPYTMQNEQPASQFEVNAGA